MTGTLPATFKNWSDASTYRTVADSYSQSQVDSAVSAKLDSSAIADYSTTSQMNSALADKADSSALASYALSSDVTDGLANKVNNADLASYALVANVYTQAEVDSALADKIDSADVYSKGEIDTQMSGKASASTVSGLVDYKALVKVLARALQASLTLQDPDTPANAFDWSGLVA
jgi:hypothetical protein